MVCANVMFFQSTAYFSISSYSTGTYAPVPISVQILPNFHIVVVPPLKVYQHSKPTTKTLSIPLSLSTSLVVDLAF